LVSPSFLPHIQHDSCGSAGAEGGDRFVDLLQREGVRDEAAEAHFALVDEADEAGDFDIGRNAAAVGTFEDFFEVERK
jgi:hypothetical protein